MLISSDTEFGGRVSHRLQKEIIIWLTTVDNKGFPQPRPVWFFWDNETILVYSRPSTAKIRHISRNPGVSLNLDGNGRGGDIIVILGQAQVIEDGIPAKNHQAYCDKYDEGFKRIGMTAALFSETYTEVINIIPGSVRGH